MKVLLRIAQYDLVKSIKNTNTEACNDDLSSDRLSSFIFKVIKMHSSGISFFVWPNLLFLFSHPMSMLANVCFRGLIVRFGAAPPNL